MLFLPTRGRKASLERFIHYYKETKATEPVAVLIDDDDFETYKDVVLPDHWHKLEFPKTGSAVDQANRAFEKFPNEEYYAMLADDVVPETTEWDKLLKEACLKHNVAWANDGIQGDKLATHYFVKGELIRKLGWFAYPNCKRWYGDNIWTDLAKLIGYKYLPEVKLSHHHHINNKALLDSTYLLLTEEAKAKDFLEYKEFKIKHLKETYSKLTGKALPKKVLIGTPTHDSKLFVQYVNSILRETMLGVMEGVVIEPIFYCGMSDIALARNHLLTTFANSDADELVFIDSDEGWEPGAVLRIISHPVDIVGGTVRVKKDEEEYRVRWLPEEELVGIKISETQAIVEVEGLGTGFLRISKRAALKLIEEYKDTEFMWPESEDGKCYALFRNGVLNGQYFTEDMYFCIKAREKGFKIYLDPDINFSHTGLKTYSGSCGDWMKNRKNGNTN